MFSIILTILYSFSLFVNLSVIYFIRKNSHKDHLRMATTLVAGTGAWWNFCFIFIHNHFSGYGLASLFMNLSSVSWMGITIFFIYFLFAYSNPTKLAFKERLILMVLSSVVLYYIYCQFQGEMFVNTKELSFGWIGEWRINWKSISFIIFYSILTTIILLWMFKNYLKEKTPIKKSMMRDFLIMTVFVYSSCSFVGVLAPLLKLNYIPNVSAFFGSFWSFTLVYYILKYRMIPVGASSAAENILEIINDGIMILDKDLTIIKGNERSAQLLGMKDRDNLISRKIESLIPVRKILEYLKEGEGFSRQEIEFVSLEGNELTHEFLISGRPILNGSMDRIGYVLLFSDNAQRKKMKMEQERIQQQLFQTSKMASLGVMASGVAHELNNPLSGILGFSELIDLDPHDPLKVKERVKHIISSCHKMKNIIDGLRRFGREASLEQAQAVSIEYPFKEVLIIMDKKIKQADLTLTCDIPAHIPLVDINVNHFEGVFQNFIANSIDAFEEQTLHRERKISLKASFDKEKNKVIVVYSDNAGGMLPEVVDQIFDPFFTTKEVGKGTGLGMSIAYNVIKKHGGEIQVQSEWGKGSSFIISLPVADEILLENSNKEQEKIKDLTEFKWEENLKDKKVLVVDDDPMVLGIFEDFLKDKVNLKSFSDALQAQDILKKEDFDLVISDVNMPKVSGIAMARTVRTHQSDKTKIIIISGNIQEKKDWDQLHDLKINAFLAKPYSQLSIQKEVYYLLSTFSSSSSSSSKIK